MDKIFPKKAKRRHAIWWWMAFWFVFCIGVLLGVNIALLVFASTSVVLVTLLEGFSVWLAYIISLAVATLLGTAFLIGYMWTFAGASSTFEAARAYAEEHGTRWAWPQTLVVGLEGFFILLDIISLLYRKQFFSTKGADQLFWFFIVLSLLSPVVGLLMHILENKPLSYRMSEARQHGENLMGDDVYSAIEQMPRDRRTRVLMDSTGEELADYFCEQQEAENSRILAEQQEELARQEQEQERRQKQQTAKRPLLLIPFRGAQRMDRFANGDDPKAQGFQKAQVNQADHLSQNGRH